MPDIDEPAEKKSFLRDCYKPAFPVGRQALSYGPFFV